jgi:hypothetical protein
VNKGKQLFLRRTAAGSQGDTAHTRNLKEGSPIHIQSRLLVRKKKDRLVKKTAFI